MKRKVLWLCRVGVFRQVSRGGDSLCIVLLPKQFVDEAMEKKVGVGACVVREQKVVGLM